MDQPMMNQPMTGRMTTHRRWAGGKPAPAIDRSTMEVTVMIGLALAAAMMVVVLLSGPTIAGVIGLVNLTLVSVMTGMWHTLTS